MPKFFSSEHRTEWKTSLSRKRDTESDISRLRDTGLISVFGLGLKVLVMGEIFSASSDTFGGLLQTYRSLFDMTSIFALTLIMIILVIVFEFIIKKIEAKIKY